MGDDNEAIQAEQFGANSQPFYFFVDAEDNRLADKGYGYEPSVAKFLVPLEGVKAKYKELHKRRRRGLLFLFRGEGEV